MTYVEFFDQSSIENICSCLTNLPDRVVIVGYEANQLKKHIDIYHNFLSNRGIESVQFHARVVEKNSLSHAIEMIESIIEEFYDPIFDLTGGDPLLTMALGIVLNENRFRHFQVHRFIVRKNEVIDCDQDGQTIFKTPPKLSVEENVMLYKGKVMLGDIDSNLTYRWDLNDEFLRDFDTVWSLCMHSRTHTTTHWNKQMNVFDVLIKHFTTQPEQLSYDVSLESLRAKLNSEHLPLYRNTAILDDLMNAGVIGPYTVVGDRFIVSFKNVQIKRLLSSAGAVLEMKTYLRMKAIKDKNGDPLFNDILTGVVIDWDGKREVSTPGNIVYNVDNEIDVLAMHNMVPVFVSCKNGFLNNADELYKLNDVARRFGNEYAKKVLVTASRSLEGSVGDVICRRAANMGINVIKGAENLTDKEFADKIRKLL